MNAQELRRYSRHFLLEQVGEAGQMRLKQSSVLVVGAGGLGSPLLMYLAAAGVGRIGLIDFDRVDDSNLQRQVIYDSADVGSFKTEAASKRLSSMNPFIQIELHNERLTEANALELFKKYDVIADGADNFSTRYLCNDASYFASRPLVSASIMGFEGQLSVFNFNKGPCYRCLYPIAPPEGTVPSCAEAGVLGVLPGVMGTLQGLEVLKLILKIGSPISESLLYFDALSGDFQKLNFLKNPECPLCSKSATISKVNSADSPICSTHSSDLEISSEKLKECLQQNLPILLVDVREPSEHQLGHIQGSLLIPVNSLPGEISSLDKNKKIVVYCQAGARGSRACAILAEKGFDVVNLTGGYLEWKRKP